MTTEILGFEVYGGGLGRLLTELDVAAPTETPKTVFCLNPHSYTESTTDPEFRLALDSATCLLPDGVGVSIAAWLLHRTARATKIPGPDFFAAVCALDREQRLGLRHFFLGASEQTLESLARNVTAKYGIDVCGTFSPPYAPTFDDETNASMVEAVNASGADVLWVGMTAPKQEKWIHRNRSALKVKLAAGVGALFDFEAGTIKRAPAFLRAIGLEGYYRFLIEPRRLARRVFVTDLYFVRQVFVSLLRDGRRR